MLRVAYPTRSTSFATVRFVEVASAKMLALAETVID
jgi:hypothetical protein